MTLSRIILSWTLQKPIIYNAPPKNANALESIFYAMLKMKKYQLEKNEKKWGGGQ